MSFKGKVNIIQCIKNGECVDTKKNSDSIMKFICSLENESRWSQLISGPSLYEKAFGINQMLVGDFSYKASCGWLARCKWRYWIELKKIQGEKMFVNVTSADSFVEYLKGFLDQKEDDLNFVYNADERDDRYFSCCC